LKVKDRTGKSAGRKPQLAIVGEQEVAGALRAAFADQEQVLRPILELVEDARASIDELMNGAARGFVEQLLMLSAQEVAEAKHPGRRMGEVLWHGNQPGRIVLRERKLALKRPRLRSRVGRGKEVAIPVYERLQAEPRLVSVFATSWFAACRRASTPRCYRGWPAPWGLPRARCRGASFGPCGTPWQR
jgi:hypothetical protein